MYVNKAFQSFSTSIGCLVQVEGGLWNADNMVKYQQIIQLYAFIISLYKVNTYTMYYIYIWRVQMQKPLSAIWNFLLEW